MKKNIMMFIFVTAGMLIFTPAVSALGIFNEQQLRTYAAVGIQEERTNATPGGLLGTSYLLVYALSYTTGEGFKPCQGANITVRGLFRSYNGTTNEQGIHLFIVHTKLLRDKYYLITVNMDFDDGVMTKRWLIHLGARQVFCKGFLFLQLNES